MILKYVYDLDQIIYLNDDFNTTKIIILEKIMELFISELACQAFKDKNYVKALQLYKILGAKIGHDCIESNINICEQEITQSINNAGILKNNTKQVKKDKLILLSIVDPYTQFMMGNQIELLPLDINKYKKQINELTYDALFLESCWNGNNGMWKYAFTSPELKHKNSKLLIDAIEKAREAGKKIICWQKEDPGRYELFLPIARMCDYIYTIDRECVEKYKNDLGTGNVAWLPFSIDPAICNPKNSYKEREKTVCFAGTYYNAERFAERKRQMGFVLPAVRQYNGDILNRYSEDTSGNYAFPEEYQSHVRKGVDYSEMPSIYKKYNVFLNVNSHITSQCFLPRRIYEILASSTPLVSSGSAAIDAIFPEIILTGSDANEISGHVGNLLNDKLYALKTGHVGYREVMLKHDMEERLNVIYKMLGKKPRRPNNKPVSIIMASCRRENLNKIIININRQNYNNFEVVFALTGYSDKDILYLKRALLENSLAKKIKVLRFSRNIPLGKCLNECVMASEGEFICKMDDDNHYFANFLVDLMIPFKFASFDMVSKAGYFIYLEGMNKLILWNLNKCHMESNAACGDAMILKRDVFRNCSFKESRVGEDTALRKSLVALGGKIYSADPFNFIKFRGRDLLSHTWMVEEQKFLKNAAFVFDGTDYGKCEC